MRTRSLAGLEREGGRAFGWEVATGRTRARNCYTESAGLKAYLGALDLLIVRIP